MITIQCTPLSSNYLRTLFLMTVVSSLIACGGSGTKPSSSSVPSTIPSSTIPSSFATSSKVMSGSSTPANAFRGSIVLGAPTENSINANIYSATQAGSVTLSYGTAPDTYTNETTASALSAASPLEINLSGLDSNTRFTTVYIFAQLAQPLMQQLMDTASTRRVLRAAVLPLPFKVIHTLSVLMSLMPSFINAHSPPQRPTILIFT
jgi:hypothetical protein